MKHFHKIFVNIKLESYKCDAQSWIAFPGGQNGSLLFSDKSGVISTLDSRVSTSRIVFTKNCLSLDSNKKQSLSSPSQGGRRGRRKECFHSLLK